MGAFCRGVVLCLAACFLGMTVRAEDSDKTAPREYGEAVYFLETWIQSVLDFERIPGMSLAIVHDQKIVYSKGFGYRNIGEKAKAAPDTVYSVCSISKMFTSIGIMQLRDSGKLSLDDPIARYVPWFAPDGMEPKSTPPTIRDLLRHSGGLPCEPDHAIWSDARQLFPSREELIKRVANLKMSYPVNSEFNYSNLGYALLGEVISLVSGMKYTAYIQRYVLEPIGMTHTMPYGNSDLPGREPAKGYAVWPRTGKRVEVINYAQKAMTPAGGYVSTVNDMAKFAMWQFRVLDGRDQATLKSETLREMHSAQWENPKWGLGFEIWYMEDKDFVGHMGGCKGYKSQFILCPEDKIAVVVMTNVTDAPQFTLVFRSHQIMAPAIINRDPNAKEPNKWTDYRGSYSPDESWSAAEVLEWEDTLAVMWVPTPDPIGSLIKLTRIKGNVFRQMKNDGKLGKHYMFNTDADGKVTQMKFNNNLLTRSPR